MLRRIAVLLCLSGILTSTISSAEAVQYKLTNLGTLGGISSGALDINNLGQIVGRSSAYPNDYYSHAFIWQNGVMRDLGIPSGYLAAGAQSINDSGQIAGWAMDHANANNFYYQHALRWQDKSMIDIGSLGDEGTAAYAINNAGQIVGESDSSIGTYGFVWDGIMQNLGVPNTTRVRAINNKGQIVGSFSDWYSYAFLWDAGNVKNLGVGLALGINDNGQVVGSSNERARLWQGTSVVDLGVLGGVYAYSEALAINNSGRIVGRSYNSDGSVSRAWVWQNGKLQDLNQLIVDNQGFTMIEATSINDIGQIVGMGFNSSGQYRAVLLNPVPEPSSIFALLCGIGGLGGVVWRRRR